MNQGLTLFQIEEPQAILAYFSDLPFYSIILQTCVEHDTPDIRGAK